MLPTSIISSLKKVELKHYKERIKNQQDIEHLLLELIDEMILEAKENNPNSVLAPLIRLKIEFTGFELVRTNFLISKYTNK